MHRHRILAATGAALVALGLVACSDEDRESIESAVEGAVEDAEDAVQTAVSAVEEAVGEAASDAAELAVRNIATQQGEEQFTDAGHALDDAGLDCTATADDGLASVSVTCTGTTEDGGQAELIGSTGELPGASVTELEGQFTGTVDGEEVFSADALGG